MAFHVRLAIVAVAAVLLTAGYCAWQLSHAAQSHFNEQKINITSQQLVQTKKQVDDFLEKAANEITQLIQTEINQPEITTQFLQGDFTAAALSSMGDGNKWAVDWSRSKNNLIPAEFIASKLEDLRLRDIQADRIQVGRIEAPDKRVYFTISVPIRFKSAEGETVKVATGFVSLSYFQLLLDMTKGSDDEGILIDSSGYAISYPDQQYVGAKIDTHPIVKLALQSNKLSEVILSQNIKGDAVIGGYEKLPQSNLILILTSPVTSRSGAMIQSVWQIMVFSIAMMIAVAGAVLFLGRQNEMKTEKLLSRIRVLEQRKQTPAELGQMLGEQGKKEILREFAFGVVQILRNPLTAVIGQSQLLKDQVSDEAKSIVSKIERETRQSRDFVEQLALSHGLAEVTRQTVEAESVVMPVAQEMHAAFLKNEIQFEENVKTRARVSVPHADLKQALRYVFKLMIDRLAIKTGYKKITVNVEQAGPHVFIKISDNGAKPEKDFLAHIFDPFKVGGLGFSLLKSLIEGADGSVTAKEADGSGLEITLQLTEDKTEDKKEPAAAAPVAQEIPQIKIEPLVFTTTEKPDTLGGAKPLDMASSFALPEVPTTDSLSSDVKTGRVTSSDMPVTIRKPKTGGEA